MKEIKILVLLSNITLCGCNSKDPNTTKSGKVELESLEINRELTSNEKKYEDIIYVPIYSDIYIDKLNKKALLSATLSNRNTSFSDSIYISTIDYYTEGRIVRSFVEWPLSLAPMATVNYVIEKEDTEGGHGANFIIKLS